MQNIILLLFTLFSMDFIDVQNHTLNCDPTPVLPRMAKSLRSKSERRSKAARYARVYKPVDDARAARLSAKLCANVMQTETDPVKQAEIQEIIRQKRQALADKSYKSKTQALFAKPPSKASRRQQQRLEKENKVYEEFDAYGLSKKELRF